MMHQGAGWWSYIRYDAEQDRPKVSRALLRRVAAYARPYWPRIALMLGTILAISFLSVIPPLLYRSLIDKAIPNKDLALLNWLALGMIAIPLVSGLLGVLQRYLSAQVGEGVIYDLRCSLFEHLQQMSLRFFTNTRTGELMSRLNNDVVGSQQAITSTLVSIISNVVTVVMTIAIMVSLDWRLTLVAVAVLPLFIPPARRMGMVLRRLTRAALDNNAEMNALMHETLNVSGALLVKLFGRAPDESARFRDRASRVRDIGIRTAVIGRWFFMWLGLAGALGLALTVWLGGQLVLGGVFSIGTVIAFGLYVQQLYGPLTALTNARVEFATSLVSFERVFEVLDLPLEIVDRPGAQRLERADGALRFEDVSFDYTRVPERATWGLAEVRRFRWGPGGAAAAGASTPLSGIRNGAATNGSANGALGDEEPAPSRPALEDVSFAVKPGQLA